jgi:hypothetical protein
MMTTEEQVRATFRPIARSFGAATLIAAAIAAAILIRALAHLRR